MMTRLSRRRAGTKLDATSRFGVAASAWPISIQTASVLDRLNPSCSLYAKREQNAAKIKSSKVFNIAQPHRAGSGKVPVMSLAPFYLHKVDQCARLANDAAEPCERDRFISERQEWLRILAGEIGTDAERLEAVLVQSSFEILPPGKKLIRFGESQPGFCDCITRRRRDPRHVRRRGQYSPAPLNCDIDFGSRRRRGR